MPKFSSQNYKTYFTTENFSKLDKDERRELLEFTVSELQREKGLQKVDVTFEHCEKLLRGNCSPTEESGKLKGHSMMLNADVLTSIDKTSPYEVFITINHELEHAAQYEKVTNRSISNDNVEVLEQRLNDEHYYSSEGDKIKKPIFGIGQRKREYRFDKYTDRQLYQAQACEFEARRAEINSLEALIEDNKKSGIIDTVGERYLKNMQLEEINDNAEMIKILGMHSREQLAREELSYIPASKLTDAQRQSVIEYARAKDFECTKAVFNARFSTFSDDEVSKIFDKNSVYEDFFTSDEFKKKKVSPSEHKNYKYSSYKWDESAKVMPVKEGVDSSSENEQLPTEQTPNNNQMEEKVNINKGTLSKREVSEFTKVNESTIYSATNTGDPKKPYAENWRSIKHPESGEKLWLSHEWQMPASSGDSDRVLYAEFFDKDGNSCYYIREPDKTIREQIYQDQEASGVKVEELSAQERRDEIKNMTSKTSKEAQLSSRERIEEVKNCGSATNNTQNERESDEVLEGKRSR